MNVYSALGSYVKSTFDSVIAGISSAGDATSELIATEVADYIQATFYSTSKTDEISINSAAQLSLASFTSSRLRNILSSPALIATRPYAEKLFVKSANAQSLDGLSNSIILVQKEALSDNKLSEYQSRIVLLSCEMGLEVITYFKAEIAAAGASAWNTNSYLADAEVSALANLILWTAGAMEASFYGASLEFGSNLPQASNSPSVNSQVGALLSATAVVTSMITLSTPNPSGEIIESDLDVLAGGTIIRLVGYDATTGSGGFYFLNLCDGSLIDTLGNQVAQYPGNWGGEGC